MAERIVTMDLHTHALEKGMKVKEYWQTALKKKLNVVAITEHADCNPKKALKLVSEFKPESILLIPGIELNTDIGHVLCYAKNEEIFELDELLEKRLALQRAVEIAQEEGFLLSVSHPWGFSHDSAAYLLGEKKLENLVERNDLGVEVYNGMIGQLSRHVFESKLVIKPLNLFDYLEKNRVSRKLGIDRVTGKLKKKMDEKTLNLFQRCTKPIILGEKASFITAGSDAHSSQRVGCGLMKIKCRKKLNNKNVLEEIKNAEVIWSGPFVEEIEQGVYVKPEEPISRKEIIQGIRYATTRIAKRKLKEKIRKKLKRKKKKSLKK